jgi:hypothetical protein
MRMEDLDPAHTHTCDDCGARYNPDEDIAREESMHLSAHARYATYAPLRCYCCHLGIDPIRTNHGQ